jgi:asparagine synthase (glutamine-hydrolysing)
MCGMLGTFEYPSFDVAAHLELLAHRGPDGSGIKTSGPAVHGHVRLALRDLSDASAQPFAYKGGILSFVGEIWNYRTLRERLETEDVSFRTTGDTEVLAAALANWGVDQALPQIEGMFTFAWSHNATHVLARDRFGKVPLYIARPGPGAFAWSSERKGLDRQWPAFPLPPGFLLDLTTGTFRRWYRLPVETPAGTTRESRQSCQKGLPFGALISRPRGRHCCAAAR